MRVLIVEDEGKTAAYLRKGLEENGFTADVAADGETGLEFARHGGYDVIILDVMLPRRNGFEILDEIRRRDSHTAVLLLTARDQVTDRVAGLEAGADDYLVCPSRFPSCLHVYALFCGGDMLGNPR